MHSCVEIDLGDRSYPIHIGTGLLDDAGLLTAALAGRQILIVSNEVVAPLYLERVKACLSGFQVETIILPDGEANKDLLHWQLVLDQLIAMGALRDVTLIALGGGVVGDLTGFVAASYMRGVQFIQIPTTLLAQVDAAVGGKTAVNHPQGKNLIGAFHQPAAVIVDTQSLGTLPEREFKAGLAEVIKYGLIRDLSFFEWLVDQRYALLSHDNNTLRLAIQRSCEQKARIVAEDEREGGVRALLNLGHTFGHAIEVAAGYGQLLHGEAVSIGTCLATDLSCQLGLLGSAQADRIVKCFEQFELPTMVPATIPASSLVDLMQLDKKNLAGRIRLVLLQAIGAAVVHDAPDDKTLETVIKMRQE